MKRLFVLVAVLAVYGGAGAAQQVAKRPMTFADLMAMKRVSDPRISPSGKWVLFSVTEVSLEKNSKVNHLWVAPIAGGGERQVTFGDGEANGRFSPDGKFVALTMKDQVYRMAWDEAAGTLGEAVQVTHVAGGADGAIWSPDSKRLLFVAEVYPECSDAADWSAEDACDQAKDEAAAANPVKAQLFTGLLYRHWDHFTGLKRSHVLVVDADGSGIRDLTPRSAVGDAETPTFSLGGPLGYAWAPDSHEIAYVTNLDPVPAASTNNDVFTLRLDEAGAKAIRVSTSLGSDDGPQYSPDGKWLAFRSQKRAGYESDRFRLMRYDRQAKTTKELLPNFENWVDEFEWSGDSSSLYFNSEVAGQSHIQLADLDGMVQPVFALGSLGEMQATPGKFGLVCIWNTAYRPSEAILLSAPDAKTRHKLEGKASSLGADQLKSVGPVGAIQFKQLTNLNGREIARIETSAEESFWFKGAEDAQVRGFMVKPPNFDPSKKYPVKFLIHGGPQGAWGDAWSYRWNPELMAASGYVVVMVNPRGSTGYGQAFIDGINGDWGGKAYVDLMKGLDAAEQQFPFIDKDRECALGASYGGYMADWILTHTNRFKCIVTHDGMFNPQSAYGTTDELWFNEWEFRRPDDDKPGQPWRYAAGPEADDPFRKWSPMLHIQDAKTPTLVIHSQHDYRLDVSEGYQLFTALQRLGVPSEMLYFPDESHFVQKPRNAELWEKTVADWCDRWTGKESLTPMKH
jgi:dipeptidyl aminopeptidase/acylaminoacyl peptidase